MATFEPVDFKVFGIIWAAVDLTVYPSIHVLQMTTLGLFVCSAFDLLQKRPLPQGSQVLNDVLSEVFGEVLRDGV